MLSRTAANLSPLYTVAAQRQVAAARLQGAAQARGPTFNET
jgi:hypothetical protein